MKYPAGLENFLKTFQELLQLLLAVLLLSVGHHAGDHLPGGEMLDKLLELGEAGVGSVADPVTLN